MQSTIMSSVRSIRHCGSHGKHVVATIGHPCSSFHRSNSSTGWSESRHARDQMHFNCKHSGGRPHTFSRSCGLLLSRSFSHHEAQESLRNGKVAGMATALQVSAASGLFISPWGRRSPSPTAWRLSRSPTQRNHCVFS